MENIIQQFIEKTFGKNPTPHFRVYNPNLMGPLEQIRMKSIEKADKYTLIEFQFRASVLHANGGCINIHPGCYIQPAQTTKRMVLWKAFGIPKAPQKLYFSQTCKYQTFSLLFPALPKRVTCINFIESNLPGSYIRFQEVDFSNWCTIPQAIDLPISTN
jgi:hypothetical protein